MSYLIVLEHHSAITAQTCVWKLCMGSLDDRYARESIALCRAVRVAGHDPGRALDPEA